MPLNQPTAGTGIFGPEDLRLLVEVFEATSRPGETDPDREARAGFIVASFQSGTTGPLCLDRSRATRSHSSDVNTLPSHSLGPYGTPSESSVCRHWTNPVFQISEAISYNWSALTVGDFRRSAQS